MNSRPSWRMSCARLQGFLAAGREAAGLTQPDVAARVGVSLSTFKRWELGTAEPKLKQLFRWADAVGVDIGSTSRSESVSSDTLPLVRSAFGLRAHLPASVVVRCDEDASGGRSFPGKTEPSAFPICVGDRS